MPPTGAYTFVGIVARWVLPPLAESGQVQACSDIATSQAHLLEGDRVPDMPSIYLSRLTPDSISTDS